MLLLHLTSFIVGALVVAFATLCLASGLLYIAEIIEENTQAAKRFGKQLIHVIIFAHLALYLSDDLPLSLITLGIFSHLVYLSNFSRTWPSISLTSLSFLSSCCLVILDHFAWFFYFADRVSHPQHQHSWSSSAPFSNRNHLPDQLTFIDITTFFTLCVWIVPFFLFLSLSASDNVLPNSLDIPLVAAMISAQPPSPYVSDELDLFHKPSTPLQSGTPRARSMLKGMLQSCISSLPRVGSNTGRRTSSRPNEGLLGGSLNDYQSYPPSPAFQPSPPPSSAMVGPSPPTSPAGVTILARRLSLCRNSASTSPRRTFSSKFDDHFGPSASLLPSPRCASSSASFSLSSSLPISDPDDFRCTPKLGFEHVFSPVSPAPNSTFH